MSAMLLAPLTLATTPMPLGQSHWVYQDIPYDFASKEWHYFVADCPAGE